MDKDVINHINVERTLNELGIDIFLLKPNSEKYVYKICSICKKEEIKKFRYLNIFKQFKCLTCSNRIISQNDTNKFERLRNWMKNNKHPRLGAKVTPENRKKMTEGSKNRVRSKEEIQKARERMLGNKNPFYNKTHSEETKRKMSENKKEITKRGKESPLYGKILGHCKNHKFTDKKGREFKLKSGWEVKTAQFLDDNNIDWNYESKSFPITYEYDGKIKDGTYIPDFFLKDEIWEIKGYWRKDAKIKFDKFVETYPNIQIKILGRKELREMGVKV